MGSPLETIAAFLGSDSFPISTLYNLVVFPDFGKFIMAGSDLNFLLLPRDFILTVLERRIVFIP